MRITIINILISLLYFGLAGCEKKEEMIPSDITNLQTQSSPGQISLYWELPSDETIRYTKVSYYDKLQGKEVTRLASIYSDSLLIPNTRKNTVLIHSQYSRSVIRIPEGKYKQSRRLLKPLLLLSKKKVNK